MARVNEILANSISALVWDTSERMKILFARFPQLESIDPWLLDDQQLVKDLVELGDVSRRVGRIIEDAGYLTPQSVRIMHEFERDRPGSLTRLDEWKRRRESPTNHGDAA